MKLIGPRKNRLARRHFVDGSGRGPGGDRRVGGTKRPNEVPEISRGPYERYAATPAHGAKSSPTKDQLLRPKCPQAFHRQWFTAAKLTTFMAGIRSFMKACAVSGQKLKVRFSEHTFDQDNRVPVSRVATHPDVGDRVSIQTGRLSQVLNRPIQRSTRPPNLSVRHEAVPLPHVTTPQPSLLCRRIEGRSSDFQII